MSYQIHSDITLCKNISIELNMVSNIMT